MASSMAPMRCQAMRVHLVAPVGIESLIACQTCLNSGFVVLSGYRSCLSLAIAAWNCALLHHKGGFIAVIHELIAHVCSWNGKHLLGVPPVLGQCLSLSADDEMLQDTHRIEVPKPGESR